MDPVDLIAAAAAAGAIAGLKDTAAQAVKDAYEALKGQLQARYPSIDLGPMEVKPESTAKRDSLAEDLADAEAGSDEALLALARALVVVVCHHDREAVNAIGVNLEAVSAAYLNVGEVHSSGSGVVVRNSDFSGGIDIGKIIAEQSPKVQGR
jgi:hypothetical protein